MPLAVAVAPWVALLALRDDRAPFCLAGAWAGGGAVLGSDPVAVAEGDAALAALAATGAGDLAPDAGAPGAVGGGWFGVLGAGLADAVEALPPGPPRPAPLPTARLGRYDHVLRLDAAGRWWFEALVTPERRDALAARRERLAARLAAAAGGAGGFEVGRPAPTGPGWAGHAAAVAEGLEAIAAGEIFQANLTLRTEATFAGDPAAAWAAACARLRPAYAAFVGLGDGAAVLSLSPELFLRRHGHAVVSSPIKGTAPRPEDDAAAAQAAREALVASAKDAAEHVMIVDLVRNDLGRVCAYGSVEADPVPRAEAHPGLWHLVSDVRGTLRPGASDADVVRAAFPPGSVTGAPKVQALKVIRRVEATGREAYTGAVGFASPLAGLELNVAIRTFEVAAGRIWLGTGGGVVADSDPSGEAHEAWRKAAPLWAALGADLRPPEPGTGDEGRWLPGRAVTHPRPDPAHGLLETLLVRDRRPVRAAAHLARLEASVATVLGTAPPADLAERVAGAARRADGDARLRVRVRPAREPGAGGALLEVEVELAPAGPAAGAPDPVPLLPVVLPGGLGAHKWADRGLPDASTAAAGGATPLFVDLDGSVLEAAWGNVWLLEGDRLVTPPADGRLLPGVTRARVLAGAGAALGRRAVEEPVDGGRLAAADAVVLTSAVRLATPAAVQGGGRTAVNAAVRLAAGLRTALGAASGSAAVAGAR